MTTRKQIEANRRNAKKSTGPRTPEGKAASAQNARKHGLLSRWPVLPEEDAAQYEELRINLQLELSPLGQLETLLVHRLAGVQWRLARVPALEAELFERMRYDALGNDEGLGAAWVRDAEPYGGALARLSRYETTLERNGARLLNELRQLQAVRLKAEWQELQAELAARQNYPYDYARMWPGAPGASPRPTDVGLPPSEGGGLRGALPPGWPGPTPEERAADQARAAAYAARQAPSFGGDRTAPAGRGEASLRNEANSSSLSLPADHCSRPGNGM